MWLTGQALLQAFTMIQLETLDFGTTARDTMKELTLAEYQAQVNERDNAFELQDNRFAVVATRLFEVTSYICDDAQYHYVEVTTAPDCFNSSCAIDTVNDEHAKIYLCDSHFEANALFAALISARLAECYGSEPA